MRVRGYIRRLGQKHLVQNFFRFLKHYFYCKFGPNIFGPNFLGPNYSCPRVIVPNVKQPIWTLPSNNKSTKNWMSSIKTDTTFNAQKAYLWVWICLWSNIRKNKQSLISKIGTHPIPFDISLWCINQIKLLIKTLNSQAQTQLWN